MLLVFLDISKSENYRAVGGIEVEWSKLFTKITSNHKLEFNKCKCTEYSEET